MPYSEIIAVLESYQANKYMALWKLDQRLHGRYLPLGIKSWI